MRLLERRGFANRRYDLRPSVVCRVVTDYSTKVTEADVLVTDRVL